ncbi:hypothetical protein OSB04_007575 [Centaurea solstitialis]|uniref:J domain-containing protein n=1 Tax=Centaurea solstitialis TaxID=347529 RepID=A0AA38WQY2_9ASTR|nr:hypothetical protein OSB04_007575 [Centaurea solstitialis]
MAKRAMLIALVGTLVHNSGNFNIYGHHDGTDELLVISRPTHISTLYALISGGIKPSDAASEVKKAYRKADLRHHPDKVTPLEKNPRSATEHDDSDYVHRGDPELYRT